MAIKVSEQRARQVTRDLLLFRNWNTNPVAKNGQLLEEAEYKNYSFLNEIFSSSSKPGTSFGKPDFLLVDSSTGLRPLVIIETKASVAQAPEAIREAMHYADACLKHGIDVLCVGIAGGDHELCTVCVRRNIRGEWKDLLLNGAPIDWIPSHAQVRKILSHPNMLEVQPEKPGSEVLNAQASRLNEILRECKIKDEFRPSIAATIMLALWQGEVIVDPEIVLSQINGNVAAALKRAGKPELCHSLRVDTENTMLASRAWEIIDILKKLNIRSFLNEHDYLGQLYETFFRYTGGNTIGQYFTPRHIIEFICDIADISAGDSVLDPTCGTGGFLIGALNQMIKRNKLPYQESLEMLKDCLFGIESEPGTAALCIANMILRGDGKSGIIKEDCFQTDYPFREVDFVLMNPPFPHKKTDTPATDYIDRGLKSLKKRGVLASIVPYSLLVNTKAWHQKVLESNSLLFVATLPQDLFNPYASYNTAILVLQKGVPHDSKKAFLCRITNDGYKMKKNVRIEQQGSQLPDLLEKYRAKNQIDEYCTYAAIDRDSREWAPEAYLQTAPCSNKKFVEKYEAFIRKHGAFYIANGYKLHTGFPYPGSACEPSHGLLFSADSKLDLTGVSQERFPVYTFFDIFLGGKDEIEDLEEGQDPVVSTSEFMNGVTAWKKANQLYQGPLITVATDGSTCSSFVQEFDFYAFYKVALLKPREEYQIPVDALYYIAFMLSQEHWKYVYARKFGKARLQNTRLLLPAHDGLPDFEKMASLTRHTAAFDIIRWYRCSQATP